MISAILVTAWFRGRNGVGELLGRAIRVKVKPQWFLYALVFPLTWQWFGLSLWATLTSTEINYPPLGAYFSSWLFIAGISTLYFITEELGWRGFLLPRMLSQYPWLKASLLVGIIWAVWHYPYWFTASWGATGSWVDTCLMVLASTGSAIALSVIITYLFKNTRGSVFLAMIFHGSNNANFDKMFTAAGDTATSGPSFLLIQAATAIVAALILVTCVACWPQATRSS